MNQREFLYICARGNFKKVEQAIKDGASINRRAKYQGILVPPLFVAVMEGNLDAITVLIQHNAKCFHGFIAAMMLRNKSMLEFLIDYCGADVNCKDTHGRTPLLCAVAANQTETVKWLIEFGADVNMPVGLGYNVLTYAILMTDGEEYPTPNKNIIKILIKAGSNTDEALAAAIKSNNLKLAKILIQNGADINQRVITQSPLSMAILNLADWEDEALPMIKFLVKKGADVNEILDFVKVGEEDGFLTTNLNLAISMGSPKCVEILLKNGADPNFVDTKGKTPLMYAALTSFEILEILLKYGADPNISDFEGRTPLMLASLDSDAEDGIVETLLEYGADPDKQDDKGYTALIWTVNDTDRSPEIFISALIRTGAISAENGAALCSTAVLFDLLRREIQLNNVKTLLKYGAKPEMKNRKGINAFACAMLNGDEEMIEILRQASSAKTKN